MTEGLTNLKGDGVDGEMGYDDFSWPSNVAFESFFTYTTEDLAPIVLEAVAEEVSEKVAKGILEEMVVGNVNEGVHEGGVAEDERMPNTTDDVVLVSEGGMR